jgi:hypothetical protein
MDQLRKPITSRERGAALIIVLAFVVLLTGVSVAYLSRTTSDRQVAHGSFNQSKADQLVASAMDNIIGDLRKEIANGSTATTEPDGTKVYAPTAAANMIPQRSGNAAGAPNLIRRSVRSDSLSGNPGLPSRASAVNSTTNVSANGRLVTAARWNTHYLVPKQNTGTDDSIPIDAFANATPDWVFITSDPTNTDAGRRVITTPDPLAIGRYAYAIYDESGLLDTNVAGYPTGTTTIQSGRKGSVAFADLTALGNYPIHNSSSPYQVDRLVGWRNYATTQPSNLFPAANFAANFQSDPTRAAAYFTSIINNINGFLSTSTATWAVNSNAVRTDQSFVQRQELIGFRKTTQFSSNALQYLSTFSREANSPSFSPSTPAGSAIDYAALASTSTAINPNFLLRRVTTGFTRFDGTTAVVGEPLVKTRFPLSRVAWITYNGPSATRTLPPKLPALLATDPNYDMWSLLWTYDVPQAFLQVGTAPNIQICFGLTYGGSPGAWTYSHGATNRILRLDEVAAAGREPDFFELLQAGILSGSLGQSSGGVSPTGSTVFGTLNTSSTNYMSNVTEHILSIGAAIIDQADIDSIPTRILFTGTNGNTWSAYGVENLPYITQLYPIAGTSPQNSAQWATYLLFELWNPHQNPVAVANNVRLRIDGGIGIFTGGNGQTWNAGATVNVYPPVGQVTSVTLKSGSFSIPTPLATDYANITSTAPGTFAFLPAPPAVPSPTP